MKVYQSTEQQTIFDIALQHYGNIEGIFLLLEDNENTIQSDGTLKFNRTWVVRQQAINQNIVNQFKLNTPSTE